MNNNSEKCFVSFFLNEKCNFSCSYCTVVNTRKSKKLIRKIREFTSPRRKRYSLYKELDGVIERFLQTGKQITFGFTGGEPLIYPHFPEICRKLTSFDQFRISIDTNLSSDAIFKVIESVPPEKIEYIFTSMHILERERVAGEIDTFIDRVLRLKNDGYSIAVNYVMHPTLFDRIERDYSYCLDKGLLLDVKKFRGVYQGKNFPAAYTREQMDWLRENFPNESKNNPFGSRNFLGRNCNAGKNIVRVWETGDVTRCVGDSTLLGNIYTGFSLSETASPCVLARCPCFDPARLFDDTGQRPEVGPLSMSIARARQALHLLRRVWRRS